MQALSCGYYLFFLSVLLALWLLWFALGRWSAEGTRRSRPLRSPSAALLIAPILRGYQAILQRHLRLQPLDRRDPLLQRRRRGAAAGAAKICCCGAGCTSSSGRSRRSSRASPSCCSPRSRSSARGRSRVPGRMNRGACATCALALAGAPRRAAGRRAAIPIAYGTWRLTHRRRPVALDRSADKPLTLALTAAAGADGVAAARARGVPRPLAAGLLSPGRLRDVGLRARARSDDHRSARALPGAVRLADAAARLRRTARAGPLLDDGAGVPERRGGARREPVGRTRTRGSSSTIAAAGLLLDGWPRSSSCSRRRRPRPAPPVWRPGSTFP